jgi:hypothetical protein
LRFLTIDIENKPALVWCWDLKVMSGYISPEMIHTPKQMICYAWKWLDDEETHFSSEWDDGRDSMISNLAGLLDEADVVCGWNSKRFDVPIMRTEILLAGLPAPSPFQQVDVMTTARKFAFMSNKLGEVAKTLGTSRKLENSGFSLWLRVMAGDEAARDEMKRYNKGDVIATEELYRKLLPYISGHPNVTLLNGAGKCTQCGSSNVVERESSYTAVSKFPQFQCLSCGTWLRETKRTVGSTMRGTTW